MCFSILPLSLTLGDWRNNCKNQILQNTKMQKKKIKIKNSIIQYSSARKVMAASGDINYCYHASQRISRIIQKLKCDRPTSEDLLAIVKWGRWHGQVIQGARFIILGTLVQILHATSDHYLNLFSLVPSSTPTPCCVNSQLISLFPVGILEIMITNIVENCTNLRAKVLSFVK